VSGNEPERVDMWQAYFEKEGMDFERTELLMLSACKVGVRKRNICSRSADLEGSYLE